MLRVLYVVHSIPEYDKTGTPFAVWRMANMARDLFGIEVAFLIPSPYEKPIIRKIDSIPVYMLPPIEHHDNFFDDAFTDRREFLAWADAAIREFQPSIMHVYNFVGLSYQILRLKYLHPELKILRTITHTEDICFNVDPVIVTSDGTFGYCPGPFPIEKCITHYIQEYGQEKRDVRRQFQSHYHQLNDYYNKYVDGVIFSGQGFHDYMARIFQLPAQRWLIPYGIPRPEFPASPRKRKNSDDVIEVGFFGGMGPRKGLRVLLKAICAQPDILHSMRFIIVGTVVENLIHKDVMALQEKYPSRVVIRGQLDALQMEEAMRSIDIALLPSLFESYNITLRELLLRGTPVIVSDTFGAEKIIPGVNGFVFPRGDADALLSILKTVIADRSLLDKLQVEAARTLVETIEDECAKLRDVYQRLLGNTSTKSNDWRALDGRFAQ